MINTSFLSHFLLFLAFAIFESLTALLSWLWTMNQNQQIQFFPEDAADVKICFTKDGTLCYFHLDLFKWHNNESGFTPHSDLRFAVSESTRLISSIKQPSENSQVRTCVGNRSRASDTLCRAGRPFPFPKSPFTMPPPPLTPPPPPLSESDEGESWPEASVSISLTQGGLRSTWKSAEILQLLETSKRARLMKNGSTWSSAENLRTFHTWIHQTGFTVSAGSFTTHHISCYISSD